VKPDVGQLFDEYAVRFRRGERPDLREYLGRAGPAAEELAALVDAFLQAVPPPDPDEASVARWRAAVAGEPPLLELRRQRRLRRADVVESLIRLLALDPAKREKVRARYHELETGQLDPDRVDARVWEALAATLKERVETVRAWAAPARPLSADPVVFARLADADEPPPAAPPAREEEPDEIDRLFGRTDA